MTASALAAVLLYLGVLVFLAWPLGGYMARVYAGEAHLAQRVLRPVERLFYRAAGVRAHEEMSWARYATSALVFNLAGALVLFCLQRFQAALPLDPDGLAAVDAGVSFNTAVSFATNTNWQAYGGETTLSYLTQMLGLTVQNFVSAATGMAVLIALIRGFVRRESCSLGSFWVDLTRSVLYVLLPLSIVLALLLVGQGVVQTFDGHVVVHTLEGIDQTLARGPVASQVAIKQLGTNGGGYFNVNSAHPFENPSAWSNQLELLAILLIPAALCFTWGMMLRDRRQGWALLSAMVLLFLPLCLFCIWAEQSGNPIFQQLGVDQLPSALQAGGNMEGKEVRFGITQTGLWATATTAASNGSVNGMLDSFTPLGGLVPMWLMQLGEVVFGGVGSGLYGLVVYAIVAVFIAGLMVGRTPEYLGKKLGGFEMKMAALVLLFPAVAVLVGTAVACGVPAGTSSLGNSGVHGFSEILYAFSSGANNNGSAFAGLTASGTFYAIAIGICMLVGRYWVIIPVLALAGGLAKKKLVPPSAGTLPTHSPLFVVLLVGTVILVGALTFVPALALGPVVEQLMLAR